MKSFAITPSCRKNRNKHSDTGIEKSKAIELCPKKRDPIIDVCTEALIDEVTTLLVTLTNFNNSSSQLLNDRFDLQNSLYDSLIKQKFNSIKQSNQGKV